MALETWFVYLVAVIGISIAPGPNGLLALTHGAIYGHKHTLFTISGGVIGFTLLIAFSMFGIGALLKASASALTVLKWVGGGYLIWLGIQLWRSPVMQLSKTESKKALTGYAMFRIGLLSALSNPKVLLFFSAFLPQFINPEIDLVEQFFVLAATFVAVEFVIEYFLARIAYKIRPLLARSGKRFNQACGSLFVLIGTTLPIAR